MHDTSKAGDAQGNGIAEQMISEMKTAAACNLEQAGLPHMYWSYAMRHASTAWNVSHKRNLPSPWMNRYKKEFPGLQIPFGALVTYHPYTKKQRQAKMAFAPKSREGIFMGWHLNSKGQFKGDYEVVPIDEFNRIDPTRTAKVTNIMPPIAQRTSRVIVGSGWVFPYKERFLKYNRGILDAELQGIEPRGRARPVEDVLIAPPPTPHELRQDIEELRDNLEASVANGTFEEKLEAARVIEGGGPEGRKSLETGGESSDPARNQGTSSARPIDATSSKRVKHTDESILGKIKLDEEFPFVYGKGFTEEGYRKATARPVEFPSDAWQHFTGGQGRGPQSRIKAMQLVRKRLGLRHSEDKEEMLYMIAEELEVWEKLREQRLGIPAPVVDSVTMRQGKGSMTMAMTDPAVKLPQKRQGKRGSNIPRRVAVVPRADTSGRLHKGPYRRFVTKCQRVHR